MTKITHEATEHKTLPMDVKSLASKIESLSGDAKKTYCNTLSKDEKKAYLSYLADRECEMVKGIFKSFDPIGGSLQMTCCPYPGKDYDYFFEHGKEYTVPKVIARHLEHGCWWPTHIHAQNEYGVSLPTIGKKNYRFSFNTGDLS